MNRSHLYTRSILRHETLFWKLHKIWCIGSFWYVQLNHEFWASKTFYRLLLCIIFPVYGALILLVYQKFNLVDVFHFVILVIRDFWNSNLFSGIVHGTYSVYNARNSKRGHFLTHVNAMEWRPYWPSHMEASYCTFGFGAIIGHDLRTF